jgi:hypothetical protein
VRRRLSRLTGCRNVRGYMIELIGLGTISALVWVLAMVMAGESDAERRRLASSGDTPQSETFARPVLSMKDAA